MTLSPREVIEQKEPVAIRHDKAWIAIAIILGVILIAALNLLPILGWQL